MFSTDEIFNQSWAVVKKNLGLCMGLTFVLLLALASIRFTPLIGNLIFAPFYLGYLRCLKQMRDGKSFDFPDFFWGWTDLNRLGHVILLHFLVTIFSTFGFLCLILPGIWFSVASALAMPILLLQKEADCIAAIRDSMSLVKGRWWRVFLFLLVLMVIFAVGAMVFGIGLLVAMPLASLMILNLTEKLSGQTEVISVPNESGFSPIK